MANVIRDQKKEEENTNREWWLEKVGDTINLVCSGLGSKLYVLSILENGTIVRVGGIIGGGDFYPPLQLDGKGRIIIK